MSSPELAIPEDEAIQKMRQHIATTLVILSRRDVDSEQCAGAIDIWVAHLGALAANTSESGVRWACNKLIPHVNSLDPSPQNIISYGERLIEWLDAFLPSAHQLSEVALINKTLALMPELPRDELEAVFNVDVASLNSPGPEFLCTRSVKEPDINLYSGEKNRQIDMDESEVRVISDVCSQFDETSLCAINQPLVTIAKQAYDNISEILNSLSSSGQRDEKYTVLLEAWLNAISEIEAVAELIEFDRLSKICEMVNKYFSFDISEDSGITLGECQALQRWIKDLFVYIDNPSDEASIERVIAVLPEPQRGDLLSLLTMPAVDDDDCQINSQLHSYPEADKKIVNINSINDEFIESPQMEEKNINGEEDEEKLDSANMSAVESILAVLRQELSEMNVQLTSLLNEIISLEADNDEKNKSIVQYLILVELLSETGETLGLEGLQHVCLFINNNFTQTFANSTVVPISIVAIFRSWPDQVLHYLNDPSDEDNCVSLIVFLQQNEWPEPLDDSDARQLMINLSKEMVAEDFLDEEERVTTASPEDVSLAIPADINQELINAFFQESPLFSAEFSSCIENMANGVDVLFNVGKAQRIAHTLKGSANLIGANGVANLTHHMEDILEYLHANPANFPLALIVALQEAGDCVEAMIDSLQGIDVAPDDALAILQNILEWANRIDAGNLDETTENIKSLAPVITDHQAAKTSIETEKPQSTYASQEDSLHVPTRIIDDMFRMAGEMSINTSQIREYLKRLIQHGAELQLHDKAAQLKRIELEDRVDVRGFASVQRRMRNNKTTEEKFDSLEMDEYDELHGSIHSYIETVSDTREMTRRVQSQLTELDGMFLLQQRLNKELEQIVMAARMVPVSTISSRLQRSVRQACRATGKQVELVISGVDLLLDSEVLNKLTDPIMHMLRNAVDHGIEFDEERIAKGKAVAGCVHLEFLSEGNSIVVNCTDDGRGLDYERIRNAAINNGLLNEHDAVDNVQLARMILTSGFSTREHATHISGRGVGMDIVNTAIHALGGNMNVEDAKPCGCRIRLRLPVSLVTSHTIVVRVDDEVMTIPSNALIRIVSSGVGRYEKLGEEITYHIDDDICSTKSLAALVGNQYTHSISEYEEKSVLLVRADSGVVAITVDQVLSGSNLVVKSTGKYVRSVRGISGVSILGDGSVVPVLDLPELLRQPAAITSSQSERVGSGATKSHMPYVLIVDDSLSVRKSLSHLVEEAGYQPMIARDGVEAMDVMQKQKPDLVLADLEMPRMTGLELTSNIRADENCKNVPVIMITSRSTKKHRQQAERAGVSEYLTKPFSEDDLLSTMNSLLFA